MDYEHKEFGVSGLTISYKALDTINIDELADAIVQDIKALKEIYDVKYVRAPRLKVLVTNEYGEEIKLRRPTGGRIHFMDTHHYRPSCVDYEL